MWEEIKIDNDIAIEEFVGIWNDREGCKELIDIELIKNVVKRRIDAHCYIFKGISSKIIMFYKYDTSDDTTYIFIQNSNLVYTQANYISKGMEVWNAYGKFVLMLLKKYNRPVKLIKWQKDIRVQAIIDGAKSMYAGWGIKATNLEDYWLFELM